MTTVTIAMWSGPRNISTAMMYSFGNRADCEAWDEPFYAFSLLRHGNDHPLREEIIAAYDTDWDVLVRKCTGRPPSGKPVFYQKHMTHHMLPGFDRTWILQLTNAFLIRSPERVLASYVKKWSDVSLRDIGFAEQAEIFGMVADQRGAPPPVIEAEDVLEHPRETLSALCKACAIPFDDAMLSWPPGPKPFDGNWAPHWYNAVWSSTAFAKPEASPAELPSQLQKIADEARPYYEKLKAHKLKTA
jgi:hypothetical protein